MLGVALLLTSWCEARVCAAGSASSSLIGCVCRKLCRVRCRSMAETRQRLQTRQKQLQEAQRHLDMC
jgi:hypothetical protein